MPLPDPQEIYAESVLNTHLTLSIIPFGELTSADEVRALFGLSEAEIPDEMLGQQVFQTEIGLRLNQIAVQAASNWETLKESTEPNDIKLVHLCKTWTAYAFADKVCDILPLVAARTLTDSKASFQRFDGDLDRVIANLRRRFAVIEEDLRKALDEAYQPQMSLPTLMGTGKPKYDPVTGEGSS